MEWQKVEEVSGLLVNRLGSSLSKKILASAITPAERNFYCPKELRAIFDVIVKGKTPKIYVTGNRGGFCASSAISSVGNMVFRIEKGKVTAETYLDFLQKIIKQHPNRKIIIIADNARPHIAKLIKEFVKSNEKRIAIYQLPPYSPDLNPDEHVWSYLKAYELKDHQAQKTDELKTLTIKKMHKIQRNPQLIKSFFISKKVSLL